MKIGVCTEKLAKGGNCSSQNMLHHLFHLNIPLTFNFLWKDIQKCVPQSLEYFEIKKIGSLFKTAYIILLL